MTGNSQKTAPLSLKNVRCYPLKERKSKVGIHHLGRAWKAGGTFREWVDTLPGILAAEQMREVADRMALAVKGDRTILLAMGAHVIKVGLGPVVIDLMERRVIKAVAMNGACIIHDAELAMVGNTSEDVAAELGDGRFGMAEETGRLLNEAIVQGAGEGLGLGEAVGAMLVRQSFPFNRFSILARARDLEIPVTVHVAMGTDIIHFHPAMDGAATGRASHQDFRTFARLVAGLQDGVFINLGSAVILPEVFLKALSLVRNLGHRVDHFTTVNMDFLQHYRPMTNVVHRPTLTGGKGYSLVGHHEIMFPLLAGMVMEKLEEGFEAKDR